jgi:hypothetical protein
MNTTYTMDGYFKEYKEKLDALESIKKQHNEIHSRARRELSQIREKYDKTTNEINNMRKVITLMLDKGLDPVEAKLTVENYPNNETLWNNHICFDVVTIDSDYSFIDDCSVSDITCDINFSLTGDYCNTESIT